MSRDLDWIRRMEAEMRRMTDESIRTLFGDTFVGDAFWVPRVDIFETEDAVVVKVCAAGIRPDEIEISLTADDRHLVVKGVRHNDEESSRTAVRYHQLEIYAGPFERTLALPAHVAYDRERVTAAAKDGFFFVTLPKRLNDASGPRAVPVTGE